MLEVSVRRLGLVNYAETLLDMQTFTNERDQDTADEIWLLQHPPIYTLGQSCSPPDFVHPGIQLVQTDRGGQITFHGPGQLIVYLLIDLKRLGIGVKGLVTLIEQSVIEYLAEFDVDGGLRQGAPGVYISGKKIAALGLRVRRGASYHGLSFNVNMDLSPFASIDPCGYKGLEVTQLSEQGVDVSVEQAGEALSCRIIELLQNRR